MKEEEYCEKCGSRLFDKCDNCGTIFLDDLKEAGGWTLISVAYTDVEGIGYDSVLVCPKCLNEKFKKSKKEIDNLCTTINKQYP